ncbi:hypothetical protein AAHE18_20G254500 [Arachis hypogaea]
MNGRKIHERHKQLGANVEEQNQNRNFHVLGFNSLIIMIHDHNFLSTIIRQYLLLQNTMEKETQLVSLLPIGVKTGELVNEGKLAYMPILSELLKEDPNGFKNSSKPSWLL